MPVYRPKALPEFSYPPLGRRSNEGIWRHRGSERQNLNSDAKLDHPSIRNVWKNAQIPAICNILFWLSGTNSISYGTYRRLDDPVCISIKKVSPSAGCYRQAYFISITPNWLDVTWANTKINTSVGSQEFRTSVSI
jgi:hypothetical protein